VLVLIRINKLLGQRLRLTARRYVRFATAIALCVNAGASREARRHLDSNPEFIGSSVQNRIVTGRPAKIALLNLVLDIEVSPGQGSPYTTARLGIICHGSRPANP
jgi:hypothetical protein